MTEKIVKTFPKLPSQFFDIFYDRIRDNGFTDKRLKDAVNYVIDNCQYPEPTIAQFISFDKTVKLFTYHQVCDMCNENTKAFSDFVTVDVGREKPMWAYKHDVDTYNLKRFTNH